MIRQTEGDGQRTSRQKEGEIDKYETEVSNGSWREEDGVRLQMSARWVFFFSFYRNNGLFPLHQSHQSKTAPFTLSFLYAWWPLCKWGKGKWRHKSWEYDDENGWKWLCWCFCFFCKTLLALLCNHDYLYRLVWCTNWLHCASGIL